MNDKECKECMSEHEDPNNHFCPYCYSHHSDFEECGTNI